MTSALGAAATSTKARRRKPAPTIDEQGALVERAQVVELPTEVLLNQLYRPADRLSKAALPIVYGVLGGALAIYAQGLAAASLLPPGAATTFMQGTAGVIGLAAGVIFARSVPAVRRLSSGESDAAQQKVHFSAAMERLQVWLRFRSKNLEALPDPINQKMIEVAINPVVPRPLGDGERAMAVAVGRKPLKLGRGIGRGGVLKPVQEAEPPP